VGVRQEGITGSSLSRPNTSGGFDRKTDASLDRLVTLKIRRNLRFYRNNAELYANLRVEKGLDPAPKFIVGPVGFTDRKDPFNWSWLPPSAGAFSFYKGGKRERPWAYIFIHSFGYTWDYHQFKVNRRLLMPPGDQYGSHPSRVFAAVNQLCARDNNANGKSSIHCIITRAGDIIMSVDINDQAWHGGGTSFLKRRSRSNNTWTVGIELEPRIGRTSIKRKATLQNYTDRQMLSLAIFCKKLMSARAIGYNLISKKFGGQQWDSNAKTWGNVVQGPVKSQTDAFNSGFVQHLDVHEKKTDAAAQFDIAPGSPGSGWDQLFGLIHKVRYFNLQTEVWTPTVPDISQTSASELSTAMLSADGTVKAVLQTHWDSERGFTRAAAIQAQGRRNHYKSALGQNAATSDFLSKGAANLTKSVSRVIAAAKAMSGTIPQYDFATGLWNDGNPQ